MTAFELDDERHERAVNVAWGAWVDAWTRVDGRSAMGAALKAAFASLAAENPPVVLVERARAEDDYESEHDAITQRRNFEHG